MTFHEAEKYLYSLINYEKVMPVSGDVWKLDRMRALMARIGNPQQSLFCVHIAGTKGKGSTASFISYIARAAGLRVGLFTSPHLYSVRERVRILDPAFISDGDGADIFCDMISEDVFARQMSFIKPHIEALSQDPSLGQVSFFECCTAIALHYFSREKVDCAVIEVGLGGRLDATNVIDADICVMTPISLEHIHLLGDTYQKIAEEKSRIIKKNAQVISAPQTPGAAEVIRRIIAEQQASLHEVGKDSVYEDHGIENNRHIFSVRGLKDACERCEISLLGHHQVINAAVSCAVAQALIARGYTIMPQHVREGLRAAFLPGRCEIFGERQKIVLDGAQNDMSCRVLRQTLDTLLSSSRQRVIIFGASSDKDIAGMARELLAGQEKVFITQADHSRAAAPEYIAEVFDKAGRPYTLFSTVREALEAAYGYSNTHDVIVTGSLFLVAEARRIVQVHNKVSNYPPKAKSLFAEKYVKGKK